MKTIKTCNFKGTFYNRKFLWFPKNFFYLGEKNVQYHTPYIKETRWLETVSWIEHRYGDISLNQVICEDLKIPVGRVDIEKLQQKILDDMLKAGVPQPTSRNEHIPSGYPAGWSDDQVKAARKRKQETMVEVVKDRGLSDEQ